MAINLQSLSLTSAFNSIVSFFKSLEAPQQVKNLTQGAEGTFLIRMLANIFSTLSYRIVAQCRENYLSTAALESSNIGLAVNLGYSAFRGSNLKRKIQIVPNANYTLPKLALIGSYNDTYNIYTLDHYELEEGVATTIDTVVGVAKEETFTAGTSDIKTFTLFTTGISEDYVLYEGSQEVPTTSVIKEMTEDKFLVRTNPYSSVDVLYLNTFAGAKYVYGTDTKFTIRYIELADVGNAPYTDSMFSYGTLKDYYNISTYLPFEPIESIKVNAPLDHETQNLIRSKQDYANRMREIIPTVHDSSYTPLTPTYTQITYLKDDFTLLSESEHAQVQEILKNENYFGTPLPDIVPPRREVAHLDIQIALNNKYKNIADINLDIENILQSYYDAVLGATFNTYDLERRIEALSYVRYARVSHFINDRTPNTMYQLGYILTVDKDTYIASKILGRSGDTVPNWNVPVTGSEGLAIDTGLETTDGSIKWRTFKRLPNMPILDFSRREPNMEYGLGDYVYDENFPDYMFKCVDIVKSSGFNAPDLTFAEVGDFFVDGSLIWVVKNRIEGSEVANWEATTNYSLGQSVNIPSSTDFSLECISYRGTTGTSPVLKFEKPFYEVLAQTTNTFEVEGDTRFYFRKGDIISATYAEGAVSFNVLSSNFNGTNTIITVGKEIESTIEFKDLYTAERGTRDGQILWKLVEDPNQIVYPWNSYVVFDHTLTIIE